MNINRILLTIALIYAVGFFGHALFLKKTVYGDGIYYYSWARSIIVDHNINFTDEYTHFDASQPATPIGLTGNKYTIGPAILWYPWFVWINPLVRGSGYEFPYQIIVGFSSVLYGLTGLTLLYVLLQRHFSKMVSIVTIIGIAGATNALFYLSMDTVNSHSVSFFAVALFLTFLFQKKQDWFLIGSSLGLVGLVRTQDLIVGLLVLGFLKLKSAPHFLLGLTLIFMPQLIAWQLLNGKLWVSQYLSGTEGFDFLQPHILGVLFSPDNGLILWTPVLLLGFIGFWIKKNQLPLKMMSFIILFQLILVASWSTWWQGASYSGRMFVGMLPLFGVGLANFFTIFEQPNMRYRIIMFAITLPLVVINALMIVYFLLMH